MIISQLELGPNAVLSMRKIFTIKVFLSLVHLAGGILEGLKNAAD